MFKQCLNSLTIVVLFWYFWAIVFITYMVGVTSNHRKPYAILASLEDHIENVYLGISRRDNGYILFTVILCTGICVGGFYVWLWWK